MNTFEGSYAAIPEHLKAGMLRYVEHRIQPGGFLTAVLNNNLGLAVSRADAQSITFIPAIVRWLQEYHPDLYGADNFKKHIENKEQP